MSRRWRSIGGPANPGPPPERRDRTDTDSGSGVEGPADEAHRFVVPSFRTGTLSGGDPDDSPEGRRARRLEMRRSLVEADPEGVRQEALQVLLSLHQPTLTSHGAPTGQCECGFPLGEETGLCQFARRAVKELGALSLDPAPEPEPVETPPDDGSGEPM